MIAFEIKEKLLNKNYRYIRGVNVDLFFPGCGLSQHKKYPTQKYKNMLYLTG